MALTSGTKLGPYEILALLGAGGMGEVYRARDARLGREVALKVLPEAFAADSERMARFRREAQMLASLNHPHIATIHGLEESGSVHALVMELVEGPTLAERIAQSPIPLDEGLPIAKQIAEALEAAHEKGVIHRDLKPANIKLTADGKVKILDFGLAKAQDSDDSGSNISNSPTLTARSTQAGVILGTAAYMSPEQAKGKRVDTRTDIWAFGCVFFEMLTGRQAIEGETVTDVLAAVMKDEPNWASLPAETPRRIRELLRRCLDKSPKRRLQAIGEARITIEATQSGTDSAEVGSQPAPVTPRRLAWAVAVPLMVAALLAVYYLQNQHPPAERMQFTIPVQAEVGNLALSADGRMLAFVARDDASGEDMLHVERLGSPTAEMLAGTEGTSYPFWSPDDSYLGFFANGKLKKVAISGGVPQVLAAASYGRGGSWGSRGVIVYTPDTGGPLWRVNADGTNAAPLTDKLFLANENSHRWPVFLPDGNHFLFWAGTFEAVPQQSNGIYFSSLAAHDKKMVVPVPSNPGYANGHLYFVDERRMLIAVPFNAAHGAISGEPTVISDRVTYQPSVYWGAFGVGGNDTVVYNTSAGAVLSVLTWYDRSGKELSRVGEPGVMANPTISPDGHRATVDIADLKSANVDIWIRDLDHNTSSRFTFDPAEEVMGTWSRDGSLIAYRTIHASSIQLITKKATGLEPPKVVLSGSAVDDTLPNSWAPDDQQLLCSYQPGTGGSNLVIVDVAAQKMTPFIATKASTTNGQISPDGKWVAYASNESGEWEIYVTSFPSAQGKWQVSRAGGNEPRWRPDGKEIFYIDPKGMLAAVGVSGDGTFSSGAPSPLFQIHGRAAISSTDLFTYDVTKDGMRFLVNRYLKPDHVQPLTVVLNAAAGMKK
jgi:Tol biopolymer transport system component